MPSAAEAKVSGTARWLNLVTTTVLGAAVLVVVAAATPSLLRAGVSAADEPEGFPPPVRGHHPTLVPRDHLRRAFPIDDDLPPPPPDEEPDSPRRGLHPNDPRSAPPGLPGQPGHDADDDDEIGLKSGVTLKPLLLRERRSGEVLHEVKAGQSVSILREDGEWILVVHRTPDDLVTGWAKRSELLLR